MKYKQLRYELAQLGSECILETLSNYPELKKEAAKQKPISKEVEYTKAPKIHKTVLSAEKETPKSLFLKWRAFGETIGVTLMADNGKKISLITLLPPDESSLVASQDPHPPGHILVDKLHDILWIYLNGGRIGCVSLKIEGKNETNPVSLHNGYIVKGKINKLL